MSHATPLFAIQSHFPEADCVLRFLEPRGSCANTLWQRLFAGTYDKPFILDVRKRRYLQFGLRSRFGLDFPRYALRIERDWNRKRQTAPL